MSDMFVYMYVCMYQELLKNHNKLANKADSDSDSEIFLRNIFFPQKNISYFDFMPQTEMVEKWLCNDNRV